MNADPIPPATPPDPEIEKMKTVLRAHGRLELFEDINVSGLEYGDNGLKNGVLWIHNNGSAFMCCKDSITVAIRKLFYKAAQVIAMDLWDERAELVTELGDPERVTTALFGKRRRIGGDDEPKSGGISTEEITNTHVTAQ